MSLLFSPLSSLSHSSPSPLTMVTAPYNLISRLQRKNSCFQLRSFTTVWIRPSAVRERRVVTVSASSNTNGIDSVDAGTPSEGSEEATSIENLPLESKLQLKLEQKLRMKLAKKIRLRRKRLVRKRRMRKKGRWPPSKMKKNKNV
eukprot:TRINITY_DN869_c0_g1_i1.p1 TRINITY_DN869_c0_g1~~TRINITY_DN869_c0_g1_i1.p1  ORF type:complete len:145 (+),score=27.44 TRINITY_DN869_c0_g1_i1:51-485(+)